MIRLAIPLLAVLVAVFLYVRRPSSYVGFSIWAWFLTPLVRRLVDWRLGWQEPNLILLAPLLVASVGGLSLIPMNRKAPTRLPPALLFCMAAVLYGFLVGMLSQPSAEGVFGLFNWLCPLLFAAHLVLDWRNYEANKKAVLNSFVLGAGVMGAYGIYQFFVAPPWDAFWLENISGGLIDPSFGRPEPMLMRTWSTMNAPGPFAGAMMVALLLTAVSSSKFRIPCSVLGYLSFLLSAVRAAWLGWIIGMVLLLGRANPKMLVRLMMALLVFAACMIPVVRNSASFAPGIQERIDTLTQLKGDDSFRERRDMYVVMIDKIAHKPFGIGLKNQEVVDNLAVDSGILATLLSLGWMGTALYLGGFLTLFLHTSRPVPKDAFVYAGRAICISALAQYSGANIFVGFAGAFLWLCVASSVAATLWEQDQRTQLAEIEETEAGALAVTPSLVVAQGR